MGCNCGAKKTIQPAVMPVQTSQLMNFNLIVTRSERLNTTLRSIINMSNIVLREISVMLLGSETPTAADEVYFVSCCVHAWTCLLLL